MIYLLNNNSKQIYLMITIIIQIYTIPNWMKYCAHHLLSNGRIFQCKSGLCDVTTLNSTNRMFKFVFVTFNLPTLIKYPFGVICKLVIMTKMSKLFFPVFIIYYTCPWCITKKN